MAVLEFLTNRITGAGELLKGGDVSETEWKKGLSFLQDFGEDIRESRKDLLVPATYFHVFSCNYVLIARDVENYHFLFVETWTRNTVFMVDISAHGKVDIDDLEKEMVTDYGTVLTKFSIRIPEIDNTNKTKSRSLADGYVGAAIESYMEGLNKPQNTMNGFPAELQTSIESFRKDYPTEQKTAFIVMSFNSSRLHNSISSTIKATLEKHSIIGLRADDKEYSEDLLTNIRTYMHCADFGISVFERISSENYNPNVSIEVGYMMGLSKKVCLLKDQTLPLLPADLVGRLYKPFDFQDIENTLPSQLEKWMQDWGFIAPGEIKRIVDSSGFSSD